MTDFRLHHPPENLLIFKTNIASKKEVRRLNRVFSAHQCIVDWWVDIEDVDKVMRVEVANKMAEKDIIHLLKQSEFTCELLE